MQVNVKIFLVAAEIFFLVCVFCLRFVKYLFLSSVCGSFQKAFPHPHSFPSAFSLYLFNNHLFLPDINYMNEVPNMIYVSCFLPIKDKNELPCLKCQSITGQILFFLGLILFSLLINKHQSVQIQMLYFRI